MGYYVLDVFSYFEPPQSGILGMHKIQDRPVAVNGEVVIRPMMYLALAMITALWMERAL